MSMITCPFCQQNTPEAEHGCGALLIAILFFPIGLLIYLVSPGATTCQHCGKIFKP